MEVKKASPSATTVLIVVAFVLITLTNASARTEKVLANFPGAHGGLQPWAGLVSDARSQAQTLAAVAGVGVGVADLTEGPEEDCKDHYSSQHLFLPTVVQFRQAPQARRNRTRVWRITTRGDRRSRTKHVIGA